MYHSLPDISQLISLTREHRYDATKLPRSLRRVLVHLNDYGGSDRDLIYDLLMSFPEEVLGETSFYVHRDNQALLEEIPVPLLRSFGYLSLFSSKGNCLKLNEHELKVLSQCSRFSIDVREYYDILPVEKFDWLQLNHNMSLKDLHGIGQDKEVDTLYFDGHVPGQFEESGGYAEDQPVYKVKCKTLHLANMKGSPRVLRDHHFIGVEKVRLEIPKGHKPPYVGYYSMLAPGRYSCVKEATVDMGSLNNYEQFQQVISHAYSARERYHHKQPPIDLTVTFSKVTPVHSWQTTRWEDLLRACYEDFCDKINLTIFVDGIKYNYSKNNFPFPLSEY